MGRRLRLISLMTGACVAAGCQPTATPAPARPTTVAIALPPVAPAPAPASPVNASSVNASPSAPPSPKAELATKLAETQIRSIDEMLAVRATKGDGVTLVGPSRTPTPEAKSPQPAGPPAGPPEAAAATVPPAGPSPPPGTSAVAMDAAAAGVAAAAAVPSSASPPPPDGLRPVPAIGSAAAAAAAAPDAADPVSANTPAVAQSVPASAGAASGTSAADPLETRLTRRSVEHPHDLAAQLDLQLFKFVNDQPVPAGDSLTGLDVEDRGLLSGMLDGLTNFRAALRASPNLLMTRKIRPLTEMADRLRGQADLSIPVALLCRSAPGFGKYDAIDPARLQQGVDTRPVLYYEIENFTLRLDEKNLWATSMQQDLVLYDHAGRAKWQMPRRLIRDTCRSRRHDFFMAYPVTLPTNLDPGDYTLKITLIDPAAGRVAETGVRITVVGKETAVSATQG